MEEDDRVDDDVEGNSITGQIGSRLAGLQWKFEEIEPGTVPFEQPSLTEAETSWKPGIAEAFDDPFTALKVLGGFDYTFVARLTFNSNEYAKRYILPKYPNRVINGETWRSITVKEMFHFLGIMLKISLSPVDGGGYTAYFHKGNLEISFNRHQEAYEITNSNGWARDIMLLGRFKQIRMAYHPEDKSAAAGGDKCYQIRNAMNTCNVAAASSFTIGKGLDI